MLLAPILSFLQKLSRRGLQSTAKAMQVWPDKATPITVTSGSTQWTYGSWAQLIAANAITSDYMVYAISVSGFDMSNALDYQLELGTGNSPNEVSKRPIALHHENQVGEMVVHIEFPIPMQVAANLRLAAQLSCSSLASAKSLKVSVHTVTIPL